MAKKKLGDDIIESKLNSLLNSTRKETSKLNNLILKKDIVENLELIDDKEFLSNIIEDALYKYKFIELAKVYNNSKKNDVSDESIK